ncbi:MAG: hypothetical protein ACYS8W_17625 [Planctomycetota bacterium]|jgi:hypothetical protein
MIRRLTTLLLVLFFNLTGCAYLTDRARDFTDIFHGEIHYGIGIHANAQITRFCNAGLGFRATDVYGFVGRRAGTWEEHRFDCSVPIPYYGPRLGLGWSEKERRTGTVEQTEPDYFTNRIRSYHPLADQNRRLGDIGGGFCALFLGVEIHISLFELADFLTGFALFDIMDDDEAQLHLDLESSDADSRLKAYKKLISRWEKHDDWLEPDEYEKARLDAVGFGYEEELIRKMLRDPDVRISRLCTEIFPLPADLDLASYAKRLGPPAPIRWTRKKLEQLLAARKGEESTHEIDEIIRLCGSQIPPEPFIRYKYAGAAGNLQAAIMGKNAPENMAPFLEALNFQKYPSSVPVLISLLEKTGPQAAPEILFSLLKHEAYSYRDIYSRYIKEYNNSDIASWYAMELLLRANEFKTLERVKMAAHTPGNWLAQKIARVILHRKEIDVKKLLPYRIDQ